MNPGPLQSFGPNKPETERAAPPTIPNRRRRNTAYILRAAVSALCLYGVWVVLRDVDWAAAGGLPAAVSPGLLAGGLACTLLLYGTRLWRLHLWARPQMAGALSVGRWIDLYLTSTAFGSLTPARLGDFSRIHLLAAGRIPLGARIRLVAGEKLCDLGYLPAGLCLTAGVLADRFALPAAGLRAAGAAGLLVAVFAALRVVPAVGAVRHAAGWGLTSLGFGAFVAANVLYFRSVGVRLPAADVAAICLAAGALAALPVSIGGLGVREGSLLHLLALWQIAPGDSLPILVVEAFVNLVLPLLVWSAWRAAGWTRRRGSPRPARDQPG